MSQPAVRFMAVMLQSETYGNNEMRFAELVPIEFV